MTTATVAGAGASLSSSWLTIGDTGKGTLNLSGGGTTTVTNKIGIGDAATGVGAATVAGTGSTLTAQGWMDVGALGQGTLDVNTGGTVNAPIFIGAATGSNGQVTVHDAGSKLLSNRIEVGVSGQGSLYVYDGGLADATTGIVNIGDAATGVGQVTVGGTNSIVRGAWFNIGDEGQGTLTVNSGGLAAASQDPGFVAIAIGNSTGGQGTLIVNSGGTATANTSVTLGLDAGSIGLVTLKGSLQATTSVQVGRLGTGTFNISNGGTVSAGQFVLATQLGGTGIATIDGATSSITVTGTPGTQALNLAVGQRGQGTLTMTNNSTATAPVVSIGQNPGAVGQLTVSSGASLQATSYLGVGTALNPFSVPPVDIGAAGGTGMLTVNSGSSASAGIKLLTGNGGTVDLTGGGTITVGTVGATPAAGSLVVGTGGIVSGTGTIKALVVNSGGSVQPGFSPGVLHITGNYQQSAGGTLNMEIGGTTPGTLFDRLSVTGNLAAGGTLALSLINGFNPLSGNSFDLLDWATQSGTFNTLTLPSLSGGLSWDTSQLYVSGTLSITGGLLGDFNLNGTVDAPDYVTWRKGPGFVPADYNVWRSHFGQPPGAGSGSIFSAVPEPASGALFFIALAFGTLRRRNK